MGNVNKVEDPILILLIEGTFFVTFLGAGILFLVGTLKRYKFFVGPPDITVRSLLIYRLLRDMGDKATPSFHLLLGSTFLCFSLYLLYRIIGTILGFSG
jgi:hypothetical protein